MLIERKYSMFNVQAFHCQESDFAGDKVYLSVGTQPGGYSKQIGLRPEDPTSFGSLAWMIDDLRKLLDVEYKRVLIDLDSALRDVLRDLTRKRDQSCADTIMGEEGAEEQ